MSAASLRHRLSSSLLFLLKIFPLFRRPLVAWGFVVAAAASLAHGGCLGSTFYLDDWTQIVDCDAVDQGGWFSIAPRALTYLTYSLTYRAAGMSAVAFHAGNLLLHVTVSLALLGFAREFLADAAGLPPERARRVGGWAAVLFAVHPLCSEMPNYARARDIGLVSLFSLLAAWAVLRWRRDGAPRWAVATVAAVAAAAFSKEVGLPVAVGTATLVAFGVRRRRRDDLLPSGQDTGRRGRTALLLAGVTAIVLLGAGFATRLIPQLSGTLHGSLSNPRLGWHALTEARVFWRYLARVAWPAHLCSDHQIAWTISTGDTVAWVSAAAQAIVIAVALAALFQRRRPAVRAAGVLAAVALLDITHRLANVSSELMVEYRMYPAMVPICLLLAWGLDGLRQLASARWALPPALARTVLGGIAAACLLASARRTLDWRSSDTLAADIVAQYPCNARARQEVQEADIRAGKWAAVVARQPGINQAFDDAVAFNAAQPLRRYDPDELTLTRISSEGNTALGLARQGQRVQAFAHLTWLHTVMDNNHLTTPFFWSLFYYSSALVHDAVGERQDALDDLRVSVDLSVGTVPYPARQLRRYQAGEPLP